jgi:RNA polymerase sigma factor (sigma-70 family)
MFSLTSAKHISTDIGSTSIDDCLSRIALDKDKGALEELYRKTYTSVYSFALSILKNTHDAQDAAHDCYLIIFSSAESYVSYKKPMAWILTVTKNLCLKKLKERAKDTYVTENELEMYHDERSVVTAEDKIIISECLNTLSGSERQIIILHAVAGMKHREIAKITELPVSTVLSKYSRALKKLKKIL